MIVTALELLANNTVALKEALQFSMPKGDQQL
jgi:hypothetical protein